MSSEKHHLHKKKDRISPRINQQRLTLARNTNKSAENESETRKIDNEAVGDELVSKCPFVTLKWRPGLI